MANLAVIASAELAALGTYAAMLLYAPARASTAWALAALYILSPAILAPLYGGDMFATFMAASMIPWWVLGLAMAADGPESWRPWIIQGVALAGLWWAHPSIALWATALTAGAWLLILARGPGVRAGLERMTVAALLCAILAGYEFTSVLSLKLTPGPELRSMAGIVFANIARNWKSSLVPLAAHGGMNGSIQLGYSLVAAAAAVLFAVRSRRSSAVILCCMAALLILLTPVPGVTARLWTLVPHAVFDVTNAWPMQRLYPLLAALAAFAGLSAAGALDQVGERCTAVAALLVAAALGWSLSEAGVLIDRNSAVPVDDERTAQLFRPENVCLTRASYFFFGFYPSYFSNSPMDPVLETRLIDAKTMEPLADGSTMTSARRTTGTFDIDLRETANGDIAPAILTDPSTASVLRFDFGGREIDGVLQIRGRTLFRNYRLPQSGEEKSFGSGPTNSHVIAVGNSSAETDSLRMSFLSDSEAEAVLGETRPFARVSVEPLSARGHVIELRSLIPFRAIVQVDRLAVLETPKVYVPGYRARVDGRDAEIVRTGAGLVGVPLGVGRSEVIVDYPGNNLLRWTYGVSLAGWLALATCVVAVPVVDPAGKRMKRSLAPESSLQRARRLLPALALVFILLPIVVIWTWPNGASHRDGAMRLVIKLPAAALRRNEPLLTTGHTGQGDVIYISYLGHDRVSVGHDRWGVGGAISKPFLVDFLAPQIVEISMRSLSQESASQSGPRGVAVKWNGREVLADERDSFPPGPEEVEVGKNLIGASTCVPAFTGDILDTRAAEPWIR
jgi:hypothetical protein